MSKFEVQLTPTNIRQQRRIDENRIPTDVFVGPFTSKAVVAFLDVPAGKIARRYLTVHNQSKKDENFMVTKAPNPESNISLEWTSNTISANGSVSMELVWSPVKAGIFKETLQLTANGFKKDVYITMKAIESKKPGKKGTTLAKKFKASPQKPIIKKAILQQSANILKAVKEEKLITTPVQNKTRVLSENNMNATNIFNAEGINFDCLDDLFKNGKTPAANKENKEPMTPPKKRAELFENICFSPNIFKVDLAMDEIDYLASLPTPKRFSYSSKSPSKQHRTPIDRVRFLVPEMSSCQFNTPSIVNASDVSAMAQMPTPTISKTLSAEATPLRSNASTFDPHIFSTLTKIPKTENNQNLKNANQQHLFLDALDAFSFTENKRQSSTDRLSSETYVTASNLDRLSSETYVKYAASPLGICEQDIAAAAEFVMDKTRTMTPTAPLSMIVEEAENNENESNSKDNLRSNTFDVHQMDVTPPNENHRKAVEELVITPLSRKMISLSTKNISIRDTDIMNLKANQGSMPNLFDEKINEQLRSIENNRYFFQKPLSCTQLNDVKDESITSTTSNIDTMFRESEIRAQSSHLNLNEIGKSQENIVVFNKTITKNSGITPALSCFNFTKSTESLNSTNSSSGSGYRTRKPYTSNSSPHLSHHSNPKGSTMTFSPPKTSANVQMRDGFVVPGANSRTKDWGAKKPKKINPYKYPVKLTLKPTTPKQKEERVILYNPELHISAYINPDPFAATTTIDPFLASTMYLDEQSIDKHESKFKKWLNALVTIPSDLDTDKTKIDVGKLFNEVQNKKQIAPDTKELVVSRYYKTRFDYLRVTAIQLYQNREIAEVLTKLLPQIEKNALQIREDKDVHLQIGLQQQVLDLLFSFNSLWLRLGLEVVFGEIIPMSSNSDLHSLTRFIIDRMFKDQYLEKKYTKYQLMSDAYREQVKKHTLKKFFCLLYFLDNAKNKKIIKQNPCLFRKTSPYKETREILLRFSCLVLSSVGDVTKFLKRFGYVLTHKQTYLDEFDYAFKNLAIDLRDGVRLTRVMEIILLREDLSCQLRVPAISRMQKVHNVDVALKALAAAEYSIKGDITAKDIADGHREKTLSLLWQIIHKFRAPKFNAAATIIQKWWRQSWLRVTIARRIQKRQQERLENAAIMIQKHYKGWMVRKWFNPHKAQIVWACIFIQKNLRRHIAVKKYKLTRLRQSQEYCATKIQSVVRMKKCRLEFLRTKKSVVKIQQYFRGYLQMKKDMQHLLAVKKSCVLIQRKLRANLEMKSIRKHYLRQKQLIVHVQQKYRATLQMRQQRSQFLLLKNATCIIQKRFRATQLMYVEKNKFLALRNSCLILQKHLRATLLMREERAAYLKLRAATIVLQDKYRAWSAMKHARMEFIVLKLATESIQSRYRAQILMRRERSKYSKLKSACITIQRRYRANCTMRKVQQDFKQTKTAVKIIQSHFKAYLCGKVERQNYMQLKEATVTIQRRFRANQQMRIVKKDFLELRIAAIKIQKFYKSYKLTQKTQTEFLAVKHAVTVIQKRWKATKAMRLQRVQYISMQYHATLIQQYFRGYTLMKRERQTYLMLKDAALKLQNRYRALIVMRVQREKYLQVKKATISIQTRFRANQLMKLERQKFLNLKKSVIHIQARFRSMNAIKYQRAKYLHLKSSAIIIQRHFRANQLMKKLRTEFLQLTIATEIIQIRYRANRQMKIERRNYLQYKSLAIAMQRRVRSTQLMKKERKNYQLLKQATLVLQKRFRAKLAMQKARQKFLQLKTACVQVQTQWRSLLLMRQAKDNYFKLRLAAITLQKRFRALLAMRQQKERYDSLKKATISIQRKFRATKLMKQQQIAYLELLRATMIIQIRYKAYLDMKGARRQYLLQKESAIKIQKYYKLYLLMKSVRIDFLKKRRAAITIQQKLRANKCAKATREYYLNIKELTIRLQARIRGFLDRKSYNARLTPEMLEARKQNKAAKKIQAAWRGFNSRKKHQTIHLKKISSRIHLSKQTMRKQDTVKNQVLVAVNFLKGTYRVNEAITILKRLERLSRVIPQVLIPHSAFIATFCYGLMAQTIRSEPDKQVIELCACIILNLSRYPPTKEVAFSEYGLKTIAQMLLRWCDKECGIFITLCTLVWLFGHDPQMNEKIRKFMVTPDAIYMLRETKKLTLRKEKMRQNVKKQFGSHLNVGLHNYAINQLPNLEPDYGVIKGKPYVFLSPVFGLDTVLSKFNINV